jgi:hypothetical protein
MTQAENTPTTNPSPVTDTFTKPLRRPGRPRGDAMLLRLVACLGHLTEECSLTRVDVRLAEDPRAVNYALALAAAATQRWMQCVDTIIATPADTVPGLVAKARAAVDARLLKDVGGPVADAEARLAQSVLLDLLSGRVPMNAPYDDDLLRMLCSEFDGRHTAYLRLPPPKDGDDAARTRLLSAIRARRAVVDEIQRMSPTTLAGHQARCRVAHDLLGPVSEDDIDIMFVRAVLLSIITWEPQS